MAKQRTAEELAFRDTAAIEALGQLMRLSEYDTRYEFDPTVTDWKADARLNVAVLAYRIADAMLEARSKDLSKTPEKK
jgi:hypothetical protein